MLAAIGPASHGFLREGWFCRGEPEAISTLVARRGDGSPILALPMRQLGPPGLRARSLAGSYWPFRSAAIDPSTGVGDMRELLDGVRYAPVEARYKVYIIDEVHMLSTGAFNALLKTLEEPPPHAKFIFATTEIRKVPVTVVKPIHK